MKKALNQEDDAVQAAARVYNQLGLTECEATEAFVNYDPDKQLPFANGSDAWGL